MTIAAIDMEKLPAMDLGDRISCKLVFSKLKTLTRGYLVIELNGSVFQFGVLNPSEDNAATIIVDDPSFFSDILTGGIIGAGEAYMAKKWSSPDLTKVVQLMAQNMSMAHDFDKKRSVFNKVSTRIFHWLNRNSKTNSKQNISAHYDLGNEFFELFLDPTMMYSSAIFPQTSASLEKASVFKLQEICRKLQLESNDHLLEIGTGWGGMAIYAAKNYGCQVTTTTISDEQYNYAKERVKAAGLDSQITVLKQDYRELTGKYDKLVSVEMIEAVGHEYYQSYFNQCNNLLKQNGLMLIQAITIADQRYERAKTSVDFIQRYIFPGGCLPSNSVITQYVAKATDLQLVGVDDITPHYARTLQLWRERFSDNIGRIRSMGFDDQFCKMWEFYLCYCEGGFKERAISAAHFVCAKPDFRFKALK